MTQDTDTWKRATKKPITIDYRDAVPGEAVETMEGTLTAKSGDVIIRGVKGEVYPCDREVFEATYTTGTQDTDNTGGERERLHDAIAAGLRAARPSFCPHTLSMQPILELVDAESAHHQAERCAHCEKTRAQADLCYCPTACSCLGACWCTACYNEHQDRRDHQAAQNDATEVAQILHHEFDGLKNTRPLAPRVMALTAARAKDRERIAELERDVEAEASRWMRVRAHNIEMKARLRRLEEAARAVVDDARERDEAFGLHRSRTVETLRVALQNEED